MLFGSTLPLKTVKMLDKKYLLKIISELKVGNGRGECHAEVFNCVCV